MPIKDPEYYVEEFRKRAATLGRRPIAAAIAIALLLISVFSSRFTVQPEETGVRMLSERKQIAARFRSEGEGQSAEILGTMEKELRQIRSTAYRRVQEVRGKADAEATQVYGAAYGADPEFYAFSRTLEAYKEGQNTNSTVILTTDSDYYRYMKRSDALPTQRTKR